MRGVQAACMQSNTWLLGSSKLPQQTCPVSPPEVIARHHGITQVCIAGHGDDVVGLSAIHPVELQQGGDGSAEAARWCGD